MQVAILIFDRLTALDAVGPYEVLSRLPGVELDFVAAKPGTNQYGDQPLASQPGTSPPMLGITVTTDTGRLGLEAQKSIGEVASPDVVVVPGGEGSRALLADELVLGWLRSVHDETRFTTSVCTGGLVLGAAGILDGLRATTHWAYLEHLERFGAQPVAERVVADGKVITAAGVSSGIDMALHLAAKLASADVAKAIQLGIEYDPEPPFDSGSPDKAPAELVEAIRRLEPGLDVTAER